MHKKGISPLISTILLISFTVITIAILVVWGRNLVNVITESSDESLSQFELEQQMHLSLVSATITPPPQPFRGAARGAPASPPENTVTFTITNQADLTIDSFRIEIYDENNNRFPIEEALPANLLPFETKQLSFNFEDTTNIDYFKLTPILNGMSTSYNIKFTPQQPEEPPQD